MITFLTILGSYILHILICRQLYVWMVLIMEDDSGANKNAIMCAFIPGGIIIFIIVFIAIFIPYESIDNFFTPKKYRK